MSVSGARLLQRRTSGIFRAAADYSTGPWTQPDGCSSEDTRRIETAASDTAAPPLLRRHSGVAMTWLLVIIISSGVLVTLALWATFIYIAVREIKTEMPDGAFAEALDVRRPDQRIR